MANQIPIKVMKDGSDNTCGLAQFTSSDSVAVAAGGTGLTTQGICAFAQPGIQAVACKTTYIGICAGKSEGAADENTYVGYAAGQNVTTGCYHTIIGSNAGDAITTCSSSTLIGYNAGTAITFGDRNTAIGTSAGQAITTATDNTLVGYISGCVTTGISNTAFGACTLAVNTVGVDNVAIGMSAGKAQVAAGCNNTFVGSQAGEAVLCRDNTLMGAYAGTAATTGGGNVMIGACVGYGVVGGAYNVYIGDKAGLANTSGNDNVFIGKCAGCAATGSCCLIIGNGTCDIITGDFNSGIVSMNCVGIGTTAPDGSLHVFTASAGSVTASADADDIVIENSAEGGLSILTPNAVDGNIYFGNVGGGGLVTRITREATTGDMIFGVNAGAERMRISSAGYVGIANTGAGSYMDAAAGLVVGDTGDASAEIVLATSTSGVSELNFKDSAATSHSGGMVHYDHSTDLLRFGVNGVINTSIGAGGKFFIQDTANSFMTIGMTINQAENNDEILSLKSSCVAHGMTSKTDTDTYGFIKKYSGSQGGVLHGNYTEGNTATMFQSAVTSVDTTKSTAATGAFLVQGALKSGTGITALTTDANIVAFGLDGGTTRFIFDAEGSGHADVEWTTFSDGRLKKNRSAIPYGLNEVLALEPLIYDRYSGYIDKETEEVMLEDTSRRRMGFVAQDVKELMTELVKEVDTTESFYSLDNGSLTPVLVKAIQELDARVKLLEAE